MDFQSNRSVAIICGSFQDRQSRDFSSSWVAILVTQPDGSMYTEQIFPDQKSINITDHGYPVKLPPRAASTPVFEWRSSLGFLKVNGSNSRLSFSFPSGVSFAVESEGRVPWNPRCADSCGPEGWVRKFPLPTNYFVHSLASPASYVINNFHGQGFLHQETNYGARFPSAWVWIQGISADGKIQLVVTGGAFTVAGVTTRQYVLGFRSENLQWDFRNVDLDVIDATIDGCSGQAMIQAKSRDGERRIELKASAPNASFSAPIYFPTVDGWSNNPGSVESYVARVTVGLFEKSSILDAIEFYNVALEFGGGYRCAHAVEELNTAAGAAADMLI